MPLAAGVVAGGGGGGRGELLGGNSVGKVLARVLLFSIRNHLTFDYRFSTQGTHKVVYVLKHNRYLVVNNPG